MVFLDPTEAERDRAAWRAFREPSEGGLSLDAADHGNWYRGHMIGSNHGVTGYVLATWLRRSVTATDIRNLTWDEADAIADAFYWLPSGGDGLPAGVNLQVADFGWGSGVHTATRMLQQILGFEGRDVDGIVGSMTNLAARGMHADQLIAELHNRQAAYYAGLGEVRFLSGWDARNDRRRDLARKLAGIA